MFDTVKFTCPNAQCGKPIEVQTKGGVCGLEVYRAHKVPLGAASYIINDPITCKHCGSNWQIVGDETVKLLLIPFEEDEDD